MLNYLNTEVLDETRLTEWSDEEMMNCIEQVLSGHTYQDVTRDKLVPIATLWTRLNL